MVRWANVSLVGLVLSAGCLGAGPKDVSPGPEGDVPGLAPEPSVVIAHLDTGINPYRHAFRWDSPKAWAHPSEYLEGYPADAKPLDLSLDELDFDAAVKADEAVWKSVKRGQLYYVPGTRIVGAITFGAGGTLCPRVPVPPANQLLQGDCEERPILDDFRHGTMTASRMAGRNHSLAPDALIVSVEFGDTTAALGFIRDAGWIDVVSNSWGELVPTALAQQTARDVRAAADKALFLFASGNGLGFINGVVGQPTFYQPTGVPNVVLVGAHDNGYATFWHEAPIHVVADGYGGWRAAHDSVTDEGASSESCCTSTSAPYAAGGAAGILLEARRLLGDPRTGLRGSGDAGVFAEGFAGPITQGPLADGAFTMGELKELLKKTADPRPPITDPSTDDGLLHWTARPGSTPKDPWLGDNPYCVACWTSPVPLQNLPPQLPLPYLLGYGAVNRAGLEAAAGVLAGTSALPSRPAEDAFFMVDGSVREALNP